MDWDEFQWGRQALAELKVGRHIREEVAAERKAAEKIARAVGGGRG